MVVTAVTDCQLNLVLKKGFLYTVCYLPPYVLYFDLKAFLVICINRNIIIFVAVTAFVFLLTLSQIRGGEILLYSPNRSPRLVKYVGEGPVSMLLLVLYSPNVHGWSI